MIWQDGKFEALQGKILEFNGQAGLRWMRRYEKYFKTTCLPTSRIFISVYICVYFWVLFSRSNNWVSTAIASISSEIGSDVLAIFHQGTSFSTGGRRVETGPHWGTAFDETWPFRTNIAWVSCKKGGLHTLKKGFSSKTTDYEHWRIWAGSSNLRNIIIIIITIINWIASWFL